MKELSIEYKARRYDEVFRAAKEWYNNPNSSSIGKSYLYAVLPELKESKESEDERIRNEIVAFIEQAIHRGGGTSIPQEQEDRWIAWLEAQGEHVNFRNAIQVGDKVTRNKDGVLVNLSQLNRVALEKRDEKGVVLRDAFGYEKGRQRGREEGVMLVLDNPRKYGLEKQGEQKSIWHNEDEEPQRGSLILLIMQSGNPIVAKIIEPNHTFNHGEKWAYIDDLLEKQTDQNNNEDADILQRFSFYSYKDEPNVLYLSNVFVNEEYRNKGIGTKILKVADKVSTCLKCNSIRLKTENGSNAESLYRKNGYKTLKEEGNQIWLEKQGEQIPPEYTLEQAAGIFLDALSNTPYNNKPITDAQVITKELLKFLEDTSSYNPNAINEQKSADKVEPKFKVGDHIKPIDKCLGSSRIIEEVYDGWYVTDKGTLYFEFEDNWELVEQNPAWSEEDELMLNDIIMCGERHCYLDAGNISWLKSLKDRVQPQPKQEWSEEDEKRY